jgi:hypothetical protein
MDQGKPFHFFPGICFSPAFVFPRHLFFRTRCASMCAIFGFAACRIPVAYAVNKRARARVNNMHATSSTEHGDSATKHVGNVGDVEGGDVRSLPLASHVRSLRPAWKLIDRDVFESWALVIRTSTAFFDAATKGGRGFPPVAMTSAADIVNRAATLHANARALFEVLVHLTDAAALCDPFVSSLMKKACIPELMFRLVRAMTMADSPWSLKDTCLITAAAVRCQARM